MYIVKLALAVVLAGGVPKTNETGNKTEKFRFHMILCNDIRNDRVLNETSLPTE